MTTAPVKIQRLEKEGLRILWDNSETSLLSCQQLRQNCPCAECREQRGDKSHSMPLTAPKGLLRVVEATKDEALTLVNVWAVGNYALGLAWGDGHDSGIYSFSFLRELSGKQ